ncbi:MAG: nuclear transport factor 2 family protein [Terriglobales bacterium]
MKHVMVTLFLFTSLALGQTAATAAKSTHAKTSGGVSAVRDAYIAAYNAKETDKVAALYAADAILQTPDGTFNGRDAIRAYIQTGFDRGGGDLQVVSTRTTGDADMQYDTGDYSQKLNGKELKGRYLVVLRKAAGKWLIVAHADVVAMPAAQ